MNFDDYDNHILQKYRLAVAIALIKTTPENCTPENHLENLRNNIIEEMESFDPDMTLCEDDFNFDDDNYSLNNDKNDQANDQNALNGSLINDSQTNDSVTILKDFDFNEMFKNINSNKDGEEFEPDSVSNVLNIMRGVDNDDLFAPQIALENNDQSVNLNHTQSTYYENSQSILPQSLPENMEVQHNKFVTSSLDKGSAIVDNSDRDNNNTTNNKANFENAKINTENATFYDSQKTIIYTLHGFTDNFTHISQSQTDNISLPKHLLDRAKPVNNSKASDNKNKPYDLVLNAVENSSKQITRKDIEIKRPISQDLKLRDTKIIVNENSNKNIINFEPINSKNKSNTATAQTQIHDSKKHKSLYNSSENPKSKRLRNTDKTTDYCDSSIEYYTEMHNILNPEERTNFNINLNYNSNMEIIEKSNNVNDKTLKDVTDSNVSEVKKQPEISSKRKLNHSQESNKSIESRNVNKLAYNSQNFSQFSQEFDSENTINVAKPNLDEIDSKFNKASQKDIDSQKDKDNVDSEKDITEANNISDEERDMFEKITDSQTEVVPFKVLEELSKVKSFLNKADRRSSLDCVSDSGYKSDSQSRSSFKSALQNTWLNQSAHTLMTFIIQCPLVANTADITNEISRALGRLIDRLHQEEKYPSFLEEHLEAVEVLLKELFEEELNENQILKKDESIHRLLLLNKSSHIIKFSIEKIIAILESVHTKLTSGEMYEITHTNETENLPYIFHILETLIKKLLIFKNVSSQNSTQNSQEEEGILRKSSITDIWRKKWNFSKKSDIDINAGSSKQCILVQCSDILNKIIVRAMDGYSLISFYALQCFNLLQN